MEMAKKSRVKCVAKKHGHTPKNVLNDVDNICSSSWVDNEMETNYASDELSGSDPDEIEVIVVINLVLMICQFVHMHYLIYLIFVLCQLCVYAS